MGNKPSFTPASVQIDKTKMLPSFVEFDCPFSRLELFMFTNKKKYYVIKALTNKGYTDNEAKLTVDHIDNVINQLNPRYDLQDDISYVEFVSDKSVNNRLEILLRISFWDMKKDEARKKANTTNILQINIPCPKRERNK